MRSMLSPSCWPPLSGRLPGPRDVPLPEVALAPLTDPQHQRLTARRVLPGHHAQPRCALAPVLARLPVFLQGRVRWVDLEPQALPTDGGAMGSYAAPKTHRRLDGLTSRARSVPVARDRSGHGAAKLLRRTSATPSRSPGIQPWGRSGSSRSALPLSPSPAPGFSSLLVAAACWCTAGAASRM